MHYIEKYLTPESRVLEIGAGTGRYSHALARQGYAVDAVELVEHNISLYTLSLISPPHIWPMHPITLAPSAHLTKS